MLTIGEMQLIVNQMVSSIGKSNYYLKVSPTNFPIAHTNSLNLEALGLPTYGTIYMHQPSLKDFSDDEVRFILAHELSHIIGNVYNYESSLTRQTEIV